MRIKATDQLRDLQREKGLCKGVKVFVASNTLSSLLQQWEGEQQQRGEKTEGEIYMKEP